MQLFFNGKFEIEWCVGKQLPIGGALFDGKQIADEEQIFLYHSEVGDLYATIKDGALVRLFPVIRADKTITTAKLAAPSFDVVGLSPIDSLPSKLRATGTSFQIAVWQALCAIPFGQTLSYQDVAYMIQNPRAVRAVGTAIGRNPLMGFIPCHRIISSNGGIGGFAYGLELKKELLLSENPCHVF